MTSFRVTALAVLLASAASLGAVGSLGAQALDPQLMDRSVKPGDDFYRYANGTWVKATTIPAGLPGYGPRDVLVARTTERVRDLVQAAAATKAIPGSTAQKVGDYYASFLDQAAIEGRGMQPLAGDMARIEAITDRATLSAYLGSTLNSEADGVTANADHVLGVTINQGFEDADHNLPHLVQGGLGLPDRDAYLDPSPKAAAVRAQYQAHMAAILTLAGVADAETRAAKILALEIAIASSHPPDDTDVSKLNNPWKRADFAVKAPGMDWAGYFAAAGLSRQSDFLVWQPTAVSGAAALVASQDVAVWKDYLRFHLIEHFAPVLPQVVQAEDFAFYGKALSGASQAPDRDEAAIAATNGAIGQAVGQLYVRRYFPPEDKARAEAMAADLRTAFRARIAHLAWMSPASKQKALDKLAAFKLGLGYPDQWIDYASLEVVRGDAFGNLRRAEAFNRARNLTRLSQPVDPVDWPINVQSVGAIILFSPNDEMFAATILQPPYFDPKGDNATNYGGAGAAIAHEISHSFDELGRLYDARGRLGDWWTAEDQARYRAAGAKVSAQLAAYCPLRDLCLKGDLALSESISDLAGLVVAHDAYLLSLHGKPDVVIGGLTGEQRFFLAFAQRWRKVQTEASLRRQIATDIHPPGEYRSDTVRNLDAWYEAFDIKPGDKLYLKPEDRVGLW